MALKYIALLCLLPLYADATLGCISKLIEVQNCTEANACDCSVTEIPDNPFQNGFCDIVSLAVCTPNDCCPSCDSEYKEYEDCIGDFVATITFQQCIIDCDATPGPAPTPSAIAPTEGYDNCLELFTPVISCVLENQESCNSCSILQPPPIQRLSPDVCEALSAGTCSVFDCCDECKDPIETFRTCVLGYVDVITGGDCQVNCSTVSSPTQTPSPEAIPAPPTSMGGSDLTECLDTVSNVVSCFSEKNCSASCILETVPTNPFHHDFCTNSTNAICSASDCCLECETEIDAYEQCLTSFVSIVTFGQCEIDCQVNVTSPTRTPTRAPSIPMTPTTSAPIIPPKTLRPLTTSPSTRANSAPSIDPVVIATPGPMSVTAAQLAGNPDNTFSSGKTVKTGLLATLGVVVFTLL